MPAAFKPYRVPKTTKNYRTVQDIVDDWTKRVGSRPGLLGEDVQRAMVAQCVMNLMVTRGECFPDKPIGTYTELYFDAIAALMIDDRDPETAKQVGEKLGI